MTITSPAPVQDSDDVRVSFTLPLPLDVAGTIMRAVGAVYPAARIDVSGRDQGRLTMLVSPADRSHASALQEEQDLADSGDAVADLERSALLVERSPLDTECVLTDVSDNTLTISAPEWIGRMGVQMAAQCLDDSGAANYLEIAMQDGEGRRYPVIVCRPDRPSPHEFRRAAEERAARLAAALTALGGDPDSV